MPLPDLTDYTLDQLRAIARQRDIEVWPSGGLPGDDAPFRYRKGSSEVGSIVAIDEMRALFVMMPDLDPLLERPGD